MPEVPGFRYLPWQQRRPGPSTPHPLPLTQWGLRASGVALVRVRVRVSAVTAGGGGERRKLRGHQEGGPSISLVPAANYGSSKKVESQLQGGSGRLVQPQHEVVTRTNWPWGGQRQLSF